MLQLRKIIQADRTWSMVVGSTTTPGSNRTIAMDFEVTRPMRLKGIGWVRAVTSATYPAGLWSSSGTLLASTAIPNTGAAGQFVSDIPLTPGQTYRVGVYLTTTNDYSDVRAVTPPSYITVRRSYWAGSGGLVRPTANQSGADGTVLGDFSLVLEETEYEYKTEPPEPLVTSASKVFTISLPTEWMPGDLKEWTIQYQRSLDNTHFNDWRDIGTFPISLIQPLESSADDDQLLYGKHIFDPNLYEPAGLYYRFRYKVRTLGKISEWSEAAIAGQPKSVEGPIDPEDLPPGTPGNPDTDPGEYVSGSRLVGVTVVDSFLEGIITSAAVISGGQGNFDSVSGTAADFGAVTASGINTTTLAVAGVSTFASTLSATSIVAGTIEAALYEGTDISVSGLINGNTLGPGSFNGVTIQDGNIDGEFIEAHSITADKMETGFIDANVSVSSYIDASAIKGGELVLGGRKTYAEFLANDGTLQWPWFIQEMASSTNTLQYVNYPGRVSAPTTEKYTVTVGSTIRCDLVNGAVLGGGEGFTFMHRRPNNRIRAMTFTIEGKLPANMRLELVDATGAGRPLSGAYFEAGTFNVTATPNVRGDEFAGGLPQGLAFQIRVLSGGITIPDSTHFIEISNVIIEYEKGWGFLNVFDPQDRLRGEFTSEYISFNKPDVLGTLPVRPANSVFFVDNKGVWVPADGLVIGSSKISNLHYSQRDLSGSLCINPRFENLSTTNPTKILPADWAYLKEDDETDLTDFGYKDGVLPQNQSLVSGRVLTITLPNGYTDTSPRLMALSHKRYVSTEGAEKAPFAMSAHFRTEPGDPQIGIRITLRRSNSASDVITVDQVLADEKLGEKVVNAEDFDGQTVDGEDLFHMISYTYSEATGVAGDTMAISTVEGTYIYLVLEAFVRSGETLSQAKLVEFDNVDLALAEQLSPSDNQPIADLARRVTDVQTLLQYMLSGTKAVLPELDTGVQGLHMTAVF